jgi:hypothetical protein
MRTLRLPTSREEITPELLADLIANLRKVCNLSGTGCTVNELPHGMSIDVPVPPRPAEIVFCNTSGSTIPAYGVFVANTTTYNADYYNADRGNVYNATQAGVHGGGPIILVNRKIDVPNGDYGTAFDPWLAPVWTLYDLSNPPAAGQACGPEAGTWMMAGGLPGFTCLSVDSTNERILIRKTEGDNTRTAELSTLLGYSSGTATLWYAGSATGLSVQVTDDMIGAGNTIPASTMLTVQFWPHLPAWKVIDAACPAGSS